MVRTVCVIQARRQSTRLPDKVLMSLAGKPVLQHVIERCRSISGVDTVIVATPAGEYESVLCRLSEQCGALSFKGSLHDVLGRYWGAVADVECDYVMRVTADCPLIDPELCARLVQKTVEENADYGGLGAWPHGLDCEVFKKEVLELADKTARGQLDREHVTLWMKRQHSLKKVGLPPEGGPLTNGNRWVLDYPEDFEFLSALFEQLPQGGKFATWEKVLATVNANPALRGINQHREEEWSKKTRKIYDDAAAFHEKPQ